VAISLCLQPRKHFIHTRHTLREEFLCASAGQLININLKWLIKAQKRLFLALEDEIRADLDDSEAPDNEYGMNSVSIDLI
jgi:hypothetical protein